MQACLRPPPPPAWAARGKPARDSGLFPRRSGALSLGVQPRALDVQAASARAKRGAQHTPAPLTRLRVETHHHRTATRKQGAESLVPRQPGLWVARVWPSAASSILP